MSEWYGFDDYDPLGDYAADPAPAHWWQRLGVETPPQTDPTGMAGSPLGDLNLWNRIGHETWFGRLAMAPFAPGTALSGALTKPMPQTGTWRDVDEATRQANTQGLESAAGDLANLAVVSGLPNVALEGTAGLANRSIFGSMAGAGHNGGPAMPMEPVPGTNPGGFYSAAQRAIENAPMKTPQTMDQWAAWLRNQPGVKPEELQSLGIHPDNPNPNLFTGDKIDKSALSGQIAENTPKFTEHALGEPRAVTMDRLERDFGGSLQTLRDYGLEPEIGPDGDMLALFDKHDPEADMIHPLDLDSESYDAPSEVIQAGKRLWRGFESLREGQPTKYDSWAGIKGQNRAVTDDPSSSVVPDEAYRERLYELQRPRRDELAPDQTAQDKYRQTWDDLSAKITAQQEAVNEARRGMSPTFAGEVDKLHKLEALRDNVHDRMVDDTLARKPYWINRGMTANSDQIAARADQLTESRRAYGLGEDETRPADMYMRARRELDPLMDARSSSQHFLGGHWEPKDVLYHLRTTEGSMGSPDLESITRRMVDAVHGKPEGEIPEEMAQERYENTVFPDAATEVPFWQNLPEAEKQKWREAAKADYYEAMQDSLGSGAPDLAVRKGLITPEEAADVSRANGWRSGYEDKPGVPTTSSHHVEEVQSDWLQKLRDQGYQIPPQAEPSIEEALAGTGHKIDELLPPVSGAEKQALDRKVFQGMYGGPEKFEQAVDYIAKVNYEARQGEGSWNRASEAAKENQRDIERMREYRSLPHMANSAADVALEKGAITPEEAEAWKYAQTTPGAFRLTFGGDGSAREGSTIHYKTRADAEEVVKDEYKGDKRGIYRLPNGSQRFAPGDKLPDGSVAQTHAVKLPQAYRGQSVFTGRTPGEAEETALWQMRNAYNSQIPDAPFKGNWHELALKQAVLDAVKNGKDAVTWWPGQVHADRYGFDQVARSMSYQPETNQLTVHLHNTRSVTHRIAPEDLAGHVGPEIAEKLTKPIEGGNHAALAHEMEYEQWLEQNGLQNGTRPDDVVRIMRNVRDQYPDGSPERNRAVELMTEAKVFKQRGDRLMAAPRVNTVEGDDLKFSDSRANGMRGFYDTMLPRTANSLFKKYGVKVERAKVKTDRGEGVAHVLKITPKLREAVQKEGLPLFQAGAPLGVLLNRGREDEKQ
jgi:hypothetical protein